MKIITWNVNGLRAIHNKNLLMPFLQKYSPDVLCLQETKASADQLPPELVGIPGYQSHFCSSQIKKGYSGVAIYTKPEAITVSCGFGNEDFDEEGRTLMADYGDFILYNVYFPNGGQGPHRIAYKLAFYKAFLKIANALAAKKRKVIFCGDVNTAHFPIDLARPKENENNTGFLPIERAWLDEVVRDGWIDVYRAKHPGTTGAYTYWDQKTRARERNVGWRIDYFFASKATMERIKSVKILSDVLGSDHAPVLLELA